MKITIMGSEMVVLSKQPSWVAAAEWIKSFREGPPDGYRLMSGKVMPLSNHGRGTRASLCLSFRHCTAKVDPFTLDEAYQFFYDEGLEGVDAK